MAKALTARAVETFKPDPDKRMEIPDPALSGLYLVVQPSGAKSWALRYRFEGKPKKLTLGKWPLFGVADARTAATAAIQEIEQGRDPGAAKQRARAERLEVQLTERDKIKTLVEQYDKRHLAKLKSRKTVKRELDRFVVENWGDRDIHEIEKRDVVDLLEEIADSGRIVTANRVRAYLSAFFNWAVEREVLEANPAARAKPIAKEESRKRYLNDDEIRWFWRACEEQGFPWGALGQLLLLTGQRLGEVVGMSDREIDGDMWHLTSSRTKNGKAHDVYLSKPALEIISRIDRIRSRQGLIFTTTGLTPVSGFFKGRNHIAEKMLIVARNEMGEQTDFPHWTFHDLRRTVATGMARLGVPVRVSQAYLTRG